jgi:hypothetical protein
MSRSVLLALASGLLVTPALASSPREVAGVRKEKIIVRRFRRGGQYLIGMPDPLGCEFSLWQAINPTV